MMYERIQEMFRYITPGLYLLALVLVINFEKIAGVPDILGALKDLSAIIIVLLPFVGFVLGYFIECVMTLIERGLYWIGVPRPSRIVLGGKCKQYVLADDIRTAVLNGGSVRSNDDSNKYQQTAKQKVGANDIVTRHYYISIMARHILGAQLTISIYYLGFAVGWSWWNLAGAVVMVALLAYFWYHQNCVYMKYLFAEYGKKLLGQN